MNTQLTEKFNKRWEVWVKKRNRPGNSQTLNPHNLYILPSAFGWAYGIVVFTLFFGAINFQISAMFFLIFLLMIIGIASAFEAHANLNNLSLTFISVEDAQQGTPAKITLFIQANNKIRFGFELQIASQPKIRLEKIPPEGLQFIIPIETASRGYFSLPPITISSLYPFGIFRVWSYAFYEKHYYVYPQPINPGFWPASSLDATIKKKYAPGNEEFYDLKQVENPWRAPNLIAWKIAAKEQGWYIKTMDSNEVDYWLFKLNDLPSTDLELKLQQLSYWLQTAESYGQIYGLELTTSQTPLARGKEHLQHCLRQLASYQ